MYYVYWLPGELPTGAAPAQPVTGWQQPPGIAPKVAQAFPTQATGFSVPANPAAVIPPMGWYVPLSVAPKVAKAFPSQATLPILPTAVTPSNTIVGTGWYQNLVKPWPAAKSYPTQAVGFSVPLPIAVVSGTLATTELTDIASFTVTYTAPLVFIPLLQDASVPGYRTVYYKSFTTVYLPLVIPGFLATIEAQDIAALTGTITVTGILATTESKDTASFTGTGVTASGTLAVTEAPDTAAFTGNFVATGILATTEAQDTASFAVTVINSTTGTLAVTEAQDSVNFSWTALGFPIGPLVTTELPDNVIILADYRPPPQFAADSPYPSRYDYGWYDRKKVRKR